VADGGVMIACPLMSAVKLCIGGDAVWIGPANAVISHSLVQKNRQVNAQPTVLSLSHQLKFYPLRNCNLIAETNDVYDLTAPINLNEPHSIFCYFRFVRNYIC
jgi:hypothetical protein